MFNDNFRQMPYDSDIDINALHITLRGQYSETQNARTADWGASGSMS